MGEGVGERGELVRHPVKVAFVDAEAVRVDGVGHVGVEPGRHENEVRLEVGDSREDGARVLCACVN